MSFNARLYKIYAGMKQRCTNPNYVRSKDYLGRGIEICAEWKSNNTLMKAGGKNES